ncbi:unnamed protein product [Closterium sp. NIES-53]
MWHRGRKRASPDLLRVSICLLQLIARPQPLLRLRLLLLQHQPGRRPMRRRHVSKHGPRCDSAIGRGPGGAGGTGAERGEERQGELGPGGAGGSGAERGGEGVTGSGRGEGTRGVMTWWGWWWCQGRPRTTASLPPHSLASSHLCCPSLLVHLFSLYPPPYFQPPPPASLHPPSPILSPFRAVAPPVTFSRHLQPPTPPSALYPPPCSFHPSPLLSPLSPELWHRLAPPTIKNWTAVLAFPQGFAEILQEASSVMARFDSPPYGDNLMISGEPSVNQWLLGDGGNVQWTLRFNRTPNTAGFNATGGDTVAVSSSVFPLAVLVGGQQCQMPAFLPTAKSAGMGGGGGVGVWWSMAVAVAVWALLC